jgi:hypothetical protein
MPKRKGIFCLEGHWYGDHRDKTSVYPVLDLVHRFNNMPFIHHRCGTFEEFTYSIDRWKTKSFHSKYPLLYLGFHGEKGLFKIRKETVTLETLADLLEDKCRGVIIYFGSCATLDIHAAKIQSFLKKTGAIAAIGYKQDVDWMFSAAFEILLMEQLQSHPFDTKGVNQIREIITKEYRSLCRKLDFRMIINKHQRFSRKRLIWNR